MYFPYFRGRQYDLLALKELVQLKCLSSKVIPIIEPVKMSSTFKSTLKVFKDNNMPVAVIVNPMVGDIMGTDLFPCITDNTYPSVLLGNVNATIISRIASEEYYNRALFVLNNCDWIETYNDISLRVNPKFVLHPDERRIRRAVLKKGTDSVLFENRFNKREKNVEYLKNSDEFFSDDHLFYQEEGYVGFGDYSIIGEAYFESGFKPYAVAIHIVYFADDKTLRIHHFVSDSNNDTDNVAGKFYEALSKLVEWYHNGYNGKETYALNTFIDCYNKGYYPGLPTIKKLSIMHHLEIVSDFLEKGE